ncbi:hypothetical protein G9X64_29665 [Rhizobium sophorae]|uniref:DUF5983 domain-containing protein n=1 Tax=Rhizobium sophorae TaxID=1535242 RepID=A0A7Y3SBE2_9HYPH|nr:hypothetical protein [Rhizobium sophorae]NKL39159.1 hypothetical protein [Rhizobium leguminosarum bv. viciae]NNU40579.1 hypothetical protein [Rhizobium sophorae]
MRKLLCLSTSHLSSATKRFLMSHDQKEWLTVGGPFGDMGWLFHVDEDAAFNFGNRRFKDLWRSFAYAADRGYDLILFDDVEEPVRDLPVY